MQPPVPGQTVDFWYTAFVSGYIDFARKLGLFIPNLITALVIFFVGWFFAELASNVTKRLLNLLKIDQLFSALGIKPLFKSAGVDVQIAVAVAVLVKWLIIGVFLIGVADIFGLKQVSDFLTKVTDYLPNVIAAALILVIGLVVANVVSQALAKGAKIYKFASAPLVGVLAKWSILTFTFLAILVQLKIAAALVQTLFTGLVAALALALGLAFGLGGKELAQKILEKISRDLS